MVMKDGIGNDGVVAGGSLSMVLRRDRGRCSPVERMKGSFDSSPPAPDELRFLVAVVARVEAGSGASELAPAGDVG